ncbi:MAG: FRG domain-containing protein [Treponema sp.]|nr:FRG domain-containing protein [Treponema sp.]
MTDNGMKESEYGYFYKEIVFDNWKELLNYLISWNNHDLNIADNFLFRGHSDSTWELVPSLDRIRPDLEDNNLRNWYIAAEKHSIKNYKRAIKLFLNEKENKFITNGINPLEWLSVMQHHGAATRLLDVTSSPLIAAFFASTDIKPVTKERCIWAFPLRIIDEINSEIITLNTNNKIQELYDFYQDIDFLSKNEKSIIGYTFLDQLTERPYYQQGAFLYSMSNKISFTKLLKNYYDHSTKLTKLIFKFYDRNNFANAIKDFRNMNITYSSLFPGIDGYSKDIFLNQYIVNT